MPARTLFACLISVLLLTCSQSTAQTNVSGTPAQTASSASGPTDDLAATKADLAKMRVLVTQMQNNLGVTTTSTTPLYHQFDLQIQMWQLLIAQMERRIDRMERSKETPHRE
jgi:TolA-binding protein